MAIYKTTNKITGKCYVGQSSRNRPDYLGSGSYLKSSIKKYGTDNFEKEVIAWCDTKDQLDFLEKFYIEFFNTKVPNGYNLTDGGDGCNGYKHSEESKAKMSRNSAMKNRPEVAKRHGEKMKGENSPFKRPEVREKIRMSKIGDLNPSKRIEVREKISKNNAMKRPEVIAKRSGENSASKRPEVKARISRSVSIAMKRPEVREKICKSKSEEHKAKLRKSNPRLSEYRKGIKLINGHWIK